MSFFNLKLGAIYQWVSPSTAAGLRFRVEKILTVDNTQPGEKRFDLKRCYRVKYLNYPYKPSPLFVDLTQAFVFSKANCIMLVQDSRETITR